MTPRTLNFGCKPCTEMYWGLLLFIQEAYTYTMATDSKSVQRNANMLKRAMNMRGDIKPGDLTMRAKEIMAPKPVSKVPPPKTKLGVAVRGLI